MILRTSCSWTPRIHALLPGLFLIAIGIGITWAGALAETPAKPAVERGKTTVITVHEGTDLAVALSPDHKTIVMDLQGMLYSLPIIGGNAKQITPPLAEASHPNWSPTGQRIAFQSYIGGTFHIWTMNPDGTGMKQLTFGHGDDREPNFSPNGKFIAFASDRAFQGSYDIWTVDVSSGALKQWTTSGADEYEPAWSFDGKEIAFVSGDGAVGKTIESINDAGQQHVLASLDGKDGRVEAPSWSPDGKTLAYVQFFGAGMFMNSARLMIKGAETETFHSDDAFPFAASWISPSELIYAANGHILHVDVAKKTETSIPFTAQIQSVRPQYAHKSYDFDSMAPRKVKGILAPALSPDGKQVAFTAINQLWIMEIGKTPRQITHDSFYKQGPAWSPDGETLAYVTDKSGVENIDLMDLTTGTDRALAASVGGAQIFPAWSPDGKWIAFQDQTGATFRTEVATGKTEPLAAATFFPGRPAWSTDGSTVAIATVKPYTKRFREGTSQILTVDVATKKTKFFEPAPFESVTTRTEDGPVYSPNGKEMVFVMDDLLYTMPVDARGLPNGKARQLNNETTDAPSWSGDSSQLLYLHNGSLRLISRTARQITPLSVSLTYTPLKPERKVLIHAGRFWKGEGPAEQTDVDILVSGNRIESVTPHSNAAAQVGVRVIDASAMTVMPGLWENHAHPNSHNSIYYGDRMGRLWLAYGITELRDMADNAYRAAEEREAFDAGATAGPRLFPTGEAVDGERVYYSMMIPTTSEAQLDRELNRLKALDFDLVKLYVRLPYAWMVKGNTFAHEQMGVETASHYLLPAVALGNDGMSHISATSRTGYAYSRSFTGASYEDVREMLAQSGMFTISTLLNMTGYSENRTMPEDPRYGIAPPWEQDRLKHNRDTVVHEDQKDNMQRAREEEATVAADFHDGGLILAGTDSPLDLPSTSLHLNLRMQVKFGLAPWQALETVTSIPARAYYLSKDLGTLEKGKLADLILVSGDPLTNINDAANVRCVMKNGVLMSVEDIAEPFAHLTSGNAVCPAE
jgi:Tol biopolymer transport system component/imidazolonepropionase-like amidohydrolase